jgi:integrase/recombinase XerD
MAVSPVILPASGHAAWDDLATWWLSRYKVSTQQTYATYLPRWTAWCTRHGIDPLDARRPDVERWLQTIADFGLSGSSVAGPYDAVASIYRLAEENVVAVDPCARIARPKVHRELQRREVLTVREYAAFLTAARSLGPTHRAIAVLGGMLGLPASEMAGLTVDSLATVRGYVTLTLLSKGDKPARVPVPLPALPTVQAAIDGRTGGPLLRTRTGAGMDRRSVHRYVARTARVAGITRPVGPHALRRTVGTVGLNQGIPSRCVTSSGCCATPARRPPWPATTSAPTPSSATPPTRSPASSPAGPADPAEDEALASPPRFRS